MTRTAIRDDIHPPRFGRSVMLAQDVRLGGHAQRPAFVSIDVGAGECRRLRLDVDYGLAYIESVVIMFADGHRQALPVRKTLTRRSPSGTFDMPRAGVAGVYIHGEGTIDVIGLRL